jgi:ankyrin repeat protein
MQFPVYFPKSERSEHETRSPALSRVLRDSAKLLERASPRYRPDRHGTTPLMYAAAVGSTDALKLLLARGANASAKNVFGATGHVPVSRSIDAASTQCAGH